MGGSLLLAGVRCRQPRVEAAEPGLEAEWSPRTIDQCLSSPPTPYPPEVLVPFANARLGEHDLPPIGSDVVYRTTLFGEPRYRVTHFTPADENGPDEVVLTDADGHRADHRSPARTGSAAEGAVEEEGDDRTADQAAADAGRAPQPFAGTPRRGRAG